MREINLLHPDLQTKCNRLIDLAKSKGHNIIITQTLRSKQEQDDMYAQGRTKPGKIVTEVKYPRSMHCWGLAFDIAVLLNGLVTWDTKFYDQIGPLAAAIGLEWGGSWKSFVDKPHYQLPGYDVDDLIKKYGAPEKFMKSWEGINVPGFEGPAKVIFKGKELSAGLLEGRTYVEIRALAEAMGLKISYDNATKTVTLS
ncbi:M15 family metallopeptidase [Candidatus Formimonas warabiya]|nr:M15 family metallopeptidase [Candidatus Formimonas warabiya]